MAVGLFHARFVFNRADVHRTGSIRTRFVHGDIARVFKIGKDVNALHQFFGGYRGFSRGVENAINLPLAHFECTFAFEVVNEGVDVLRVLFSRSGDGVQEGA